MSDVVYAFLDEAGNLDFSQRGTRCFVLTSVSMRRPFAMTEALEALKYDMLDQVADYCCWAIYRNHEMGDDDAFNRISAAVRSEHTIFPGDSPQYY